MRGIAYPFIDSHRILRFKFTPQERTHSAMVVSTKKQQFEIWSRRFIRELGACETLEEWGALIAENGVNLGECSQFNASAYVTVKIEIEAASKRVKQ
jgi:hypothetical protein